MNLDTKYGKVNIYAKTVENEALAQIIKMANSPLGENAHIRIMPDCHAGAGCTIGTTMKISDKVCPNLVGVDIGCGVDLICIDKDLENRLAELDQVIRDKIPFGRAVHSKKQKFNFENLRCWDKLTKETQQLAMCSLGSLGGGNHFIEAYKSDKCYVAVHSGSRNIGCRVAEYYQKVAKHSCFKKLSEIRLAEMQNIEAPLREKWLKEHQISFDEELAYLTDIDLENYLHDIKIMQDFAAENRKRMLEIITKAFDAKTIDYISSVHNYIDVQNKILRKGAISAQKGEILVIPLNMRDGILICRGKGNEDWNFSAPHGAGRLYSRADAKKIISLEDYQKSMQGIFSTCVNESTLDESVFAYKDYEEIMQCVQPTVEILQRLKPIYNFKASE